jgi:hypothetical protein
LLDIHVYWNILTMHGPINVKSPNNTSKWQMGFNSAFKGLTCFNLNISVSIQHYKTTFVNSLGSQNVLQSNEPLPIVWPDGGTIGPKHVA